MVKAKRPKKYSFTVNQKKTASWKHDLADKLRQCVHEYRRMVVFKLINPLTHLLQQLRRDWSKSRFFLGKNKVLQIALGRTPEEELDTNLHLLSRQLVGERGILFTNASVSEILKFFNNYRMKVHSRPGNIATTTVTLEPGVLSMFTHSQEPFLRKLGLVTRLKLEGHGSGVPELLLPFKVAVKGQRIQQASATLLKLLGYRDSQFSLRLYCMWERTSTTYTRIAFKKGVAYIPGASLEDESDDATSDEDDATSDEDDEEDESQDMFLGKVEVEHNEEGEDIDMEGDQMQDVEKESAMAPAAEEVDSDEEKVQKNKKVVKSKTIVKKKKKKLVNK